MSASTSALKVVRWFVLAGAVLQLIFAGIGLPFFFLAGFAWPTEAMPVAVRWLAQALPSTHAIDGLVDVAQLGASLSDVRSEFLGLWLLAAGYCAIAVIVEFNKRRRAAAIVPG